MKNNRKYLSENIMRGVFLFSASVCIIAVAMICIFLFANGLPFFQEYNLWDFLTGTTWAPLRNIFGIMPMIVGSFIITIGAVLLASPIGILTAAFVTYFSNSKINRFLRPAVALLAGIPSVVYGFFGMMLLVPMTKELLNLSSGKSILVASVLLGIMILPTIIQTSSAALSAVPKNYYEGSLALGATHEYSVFNIMLPAARPGILSGVVLGVARAVGETTAVIMVAGNQARMPKGILKGIRTLTVNILMEMGYAADMHKDSLIATGVVLFVIVLCINAVFSYINRRRVIQ
ncbi:MAG: phosphate ABC transporter permease subunit PstC [Eubacteriales bacterium]|nr:phosphate ABC transporter permease subunit PstC [Eubacteriales bacterium]